MKTKEEVLNQLYITTEDLKILLPDVGINKCRDLMHEMVEEMKRKRIKPINGTKLQVPIGIVKRRLGI